MVVPGANVTRYIGYLVDVESSTQFRGFNPWDLRLFVIVLVGSLIRPLRATVIGLSVWTE